MLQLRLLSNFQQVNTTLFSFSPDLHSHMHLYKISRNVMTVSWDRDVKGKKFYFKLKEYFYWFFSKNLTYLWQSCIWQIFIMFCLILNIQTSNMQFWIPTSCFSRPLQIFQFQLKIYIYFLTLLRNSLVLSTDCSSNIFL